MQAAITASRRTAIPSVCSELSVNADTVSDCELEIAAEKLRASGKYRILRRIEPPPVCPHLDREVGDESRVGVVLDTETTGLDHRSDEIIELAMLKFRFSGTKILEVLDVFEGLHQPSRTLSPEVMELTGLTDGMLTGHVLDIGKIGTFMAGVDLVVAHNAGFDRPFTERLHPVFAELPWACSAKEVPWRQLGVEGVKLGYVLTRYGLFHDGHRALADCHALLEVLARRPPRGDATAFAHILDASRRTTAEIRAVEAPFAVKDVLKARGYRWNNGSDGTARCWARELPAEDLNEELRYLREEIYRRDIRLPVRFRGAAERHRT